MQSMCNACGVQEAFGTTDEEKICLEILAKGELQVGGCVGGPIIAACVDVEVAAFAITGYCCRFSCLHSEVCS